MKNKARIFLITALAMVFFNTAVSFAETEYYCLREDTGSYIDINLPQGWDMREMDSSEGDGGNEKIMYASYAGSDSSFADLNMFFSVEPSDEYIYLYGGKEETLAYYEKYGRAALEEYYGGYTDSRLISLGEPEFYDGEWNNYIKVLVSVEKNVNGENKTSRERIYLTATDSVANEMLVFSGFDSAGTPYTTERLDAIAMPIADSFYDYGYGSAMLGNNKLSQNVYGEHDDSGSDMVVSTIGKALGALLPILVVVGSIAAAVIKEKTKKERRPADSFTMDNFKNKKKEVQDSPGKISPKFGTEETVSCADAGTRYVECLHTLHKSGLLTKEELRQMIEKYERQRQR